jgi:DeoR/GlpR family transcriptional regulator of sugar metabolism
VGFAELDEIDMIITDAESPVLPIKVLEDYGIEVLIA